MKHFTLLLLALTLTVSVIDAKNDNSRRKNLIKKSANSTAANNTKNNSIPTIEFSKAADKAEADINSVGDKVDANAVLSEFPFKIARCDQLVMFPCAYINDSEDYRVRKPAFLVITAYYTNLYADKDGQKLIQQVINTQMKTLPEGIPGAEGCLKINGDVGQKPMRLCVNTESNAENINEVYREFARCRLGDNLIPIPTQNLNLLMQHCGVSKKRLSSPDHLIARANSDPNAVSDDAIEGQQVQKSLIKQNLRNRKHKKSKPEFDFPKEKNNKWEQDRLKYFMPNPLRVPGDKPYVKLPTGIQPGLNPVENPGKSPEYFNGEVPESKIGA